MIRRGGVSQKVHGKVHVYGSRTLERTGILDEALELGLGTPPWALGGTAPWVSIGTCGGIHTCGTP